MFDHVVFGVSDYAASKAFYLKALEPIGMAVVAEGPLGIEMSADGKTRCACFPPRRSRRTCTWRSSPKTASRSKPSIARRCKRAPGTTVRPACARTTAAGITRRS